MRYTDGRKVNGVKWFLPEAWFLMCWNSVTNFSLSFSSMTDTWRLLSFDRKFP
jgi:hypothetical protein